MDYRDGRVPVEAILANVSLSQNTQDTWEGGKSTTIAGLSVKAKVFLLLVVLEFLAILALTIERAATIAIPFDPNSSSRADFTYAIVLLVNAVFCLYYALYGCLRERKMELLIFVGASILVTVYVIYQFASGDKGSYKDAEQVGIARLVIVCSLVPATTVLAVLVSMEFGWLEYKTVGADGSLANIFRIYGLFLGFLKMDLQCGISLVIMSGFNELAVNAELAINIAGLVATVLWCFLAWYWVRYEVKHLWIAFVLFSVLEPAYLIWKIIDIFQTPGNSAYVQVPLVLVASLALVIRVGVMYLGYRAWKNFGQGLKTRVVVRKDDFGERTSLLH